MNIVPNKYVNRQYKISVNFGFIYFYTNSMSFRLPKGVLPYVIGFLYFLLNLFTGLWGVLFIFGSFQGLRNTYSAIHINLTGGEDITKENIESNFDSYTVYIYNNMEREIANEMSLYEVDVILEIQELYFERYLNCFTTENTNFIRKNLSKVNMNHLTKNHIESVFKAIDIHNKYN